MSVRLPPRPMPSGIRGFRASRCSRCWMKLDLCICDHIHPVKNRTRIVMITPWKESGRTSNSGRLAYLALENCQVRIRGGKAEDFDLSDLKDESGRTQVLFPGASNHVLSASVGEPDAGPLTLVVLDGTWQTARRLIYREPVLRDLPKVSLPDGPPTIYQLRRPQGEGRLCTFEAIARALGILEGRSVEQQLMEPFVHMVERTLKARGKFKQTEPSAV